MLRPQANNLSKGRLQLEFPCVWTALENRLCSLLDELHHHVSILTLLNDELTQPPVIPPDLQLRLKCQCYGYKVQRQSTNTGVSIFK